MIVLQPEAIWLGGSLLALAGYLIGLATAHPCSCHDCTVHRESDRHKANGRRAKAHRDLHSHFDIPWGEDYCTGCRNGGDRDRWA